MVAVGFCSTSGLEAEKFLPSTTVTTLPSLLPVSVLVLSLKVCVSLGINIVRACIVYCTVG